MDDEFELSGERAEDGAQLGDLLLRGADDDTHRPLPEVQHWLRGDVEDERPQRSNVQLRQQRKGVVEADGAAAEM